MPRQTGLMQARMLAMAACLLAAPVPSRAEPGVFGDRIVFGQTAALEGPAAELGRGMQTGLQLAFAEVNRTGGVRGRRIELVSLDDGYEPTRAIANVIALLDEHQAFALIGGVGTPTARAVVPIAEERGVPFIAPFTGASLLREPGLEQVINLRSSYRQETERGVAYLVDGLGLSRIAVLFQDDTYGRDGLEGVRAALSRRKLEPVADATYMRNTTAVKRAALDLRNADPQAVFIVGAYEPAAAFVRVCRQLGFQPRFMTLSFVGSVALAAELGDQGRGLLITQVMPSLQESRHPAVTKYLAALSAYAPGATPSYVSLEGYLAGRLAIVTLQGLAAEPTRAGFTDWLRSGELDQLDGLPMAFGPESNQGSAAVFLTRISRDGELEEIRQ